MKAARLGLLLGYIFLSPESCCVCASPSLPLFFCTKLFVSGYTRAAAVRVCAALANHQQSKSAGIQTDMVCLYLSTAHFTGWHFYAYIITTHACTHARNTAELCFRAAERKDNSQTICHCTEVICHKQSSGCDGELYIQSPCGCLFALLGLH